MMKLYGAVCIVLRGSFDHVFFEIVHGLSAVFLATNLARLEMWFNRIP